MDRSRRGCGATVFEPLEPRLVLTGSAPYPFVTAGISYDGSDSPTMFWGQGLVDAQDTFYGATFERFGPHGSFGLEPLPWSGFTRPSDDAMRLETAPGITPYASQDGVQFIAQQGFSAGSFVGRDADGGVRDLAYFVEPFNVASIIATQSAGITPSQYLRGDYLITSIIVMTPSETVELGTLLITPDQGPHSTTFTFDYILPSGQINSPGVVLSSETPTSMTFANGVRVFSTFNSSTNFFVVDANPNDGVAGFGVAYARFQSPDSVRASNLPGTYRGAVMTTGEESAAFFGVVPAPVGLGREAAAFSVIEVNDDHTFAVYRGGEYDGGQGTPVTTGTWRYTPNPIDPALDRGRLELEDTAGRIAVFRPARRSAGILLPVEVRGPGFGQFERLFGMATLGNYVAFAPGLNYQEAVFDVGIDGHALALQHATSADADLVGWYSLDLYEGVGGDPVSGPLYSWHDLTFSTLAVAGRSSLTGHLQLWEREGNQWSYRDLTAELGGDARGFASDIAGATYGFYADPYRHPKAAIVGTDSSGNFIAYVQSPDWTFVDVEAIGLGGEGVHPDFAGALVGFGTPWNAFNFVGLDHAGQIWSLWWSAGLGGPQWATNNLSAIAGGPPPIVSQLSAVTTPWNAFHITGLNAQGHIVVTWWAREVGWRYDGLTELVGGPSFFGTSIATSYNITQNVIAIIGMDGFGNMLTYWWSPSLGWNVAALASGLTPPQRPTGAMLSDGFTVPYTSVPGLTDSFQSVTWRSAAGDVMRVAWQTRAPDAWVLENLSAPSRPL